MLGRIGKEKLIGGGRIATYTKKHPLHLIGRTYKGVFDAGGLVAVFVSKVESIVYQFAEVIFAEVFVADMYTAAELREVNINPPGVVGFGVKKSSVLYYGGVYRQFELIGKTGLIENLVFLFRKGNLIVTPGLGCKGRIA